MLLSVVIPVFNAGAYLQPLLACLHAVDCGDIEIVAIDDGSTDSSLDTLRRHAAFEPRLRVIEQSNCGLSVTRNHGLAAAKGEYVWFVDADDLIVPSAVLRLLEAAREGVDVITFNGQRFGDAITPEDIYRAPKHQQTMRGEEWLKLLLWQKEHRQFAWLHWSRRRYLEEIGLAFFPGIAHEDVVWGTELTLRADRLRYVNVSAYQYRLTATSITGNHDDTRLLHRIHSYFTVIDQLQKLNQRVKMQPETLRMLRGEVVGQALQVFELVRQLDSTGHRVATLDLCRSRRFAESLWGDAATLKRKRQVALMWLRQWLN